MEKNIMLSVVSPIFNSELIVAELAMQLETELKKITHEYEIILVDDCSIDNSWEAIKEICKNNARVKAIGFSSNRGQQIAVSAGINEAQGDYCITIDCDLENPIPEIINLFNKAKEGYDIVYAIANKRNSTLNTLTSKLFWIILKRVLRVQITENQLLLRILSKKAVIYYNLYGETTRSVAGICHDLGLKQTYIQVKTNNRHSGKSNYTFTKRLNIFIDIVLSLSRSPLNFIIYIGAIFAILIGFISIYYSINDPLYLAHNGELFICLILSVILFTLGIMSRYLSLIYFETRNRPLYLIDEKINFENRNRENN